MSSKTMISATRHEGLTIETVRECDVCYNTRYVVIADEGDGLPAWGKSFFTESEAERFAEALVEAWDKIASGLVQASLYFEARCIMEGM